MAATKPWMPAAILLPTKIPARIAPNTLSVPILREMNPKNSPNCLVTTLRTSKIFFKLLAILSLFAFVHASSAGKTFA